MLQRELGFAAIIGFIGLIFGLLMTLYTGIWYWTLIGVFYAVGTVYGIKLILKSIEKITSVSCVSLFFLRSVSQLIFNISLMLVGICFILSFGWIFGCFVAIKTFFETYKQDITLGISSSRTQNTTPSQPYKPYRRQDDDNDDDDKNNDDDFSF
jgi:hypothetical protein